MLVIGNSPKLGEQIFSQGYTLSAVIANEFGEAASTPVYRSALFAAGLVLFVLTLLVNIIARRYVVRSTTGKRMAGEVVAPETAVAGSGGMTQLAPISGRRRRTDVVMRGLLGAGTALALVPLVLVIYYLFHKGLSAWSKDFFTTDPNGNFLGYPGGIRSAILGTIEIVALATLISVPLGIGVALYLTEYGKDSKFANVVRYFVDVMTGVPSIVFGLFIYIVLVLARTGGSTFAGWKGAIALSLLMLPIVVRSSEVVLLLVPGSLREAALALGAPRWRVVTRVVLPTSLSGLVTGALLAVARGAGETAPLLFTVAFAQTLTGNLNGSMNSLPIQIYNDIQSPRAEVVTRAWGAALTLVLMILLLNLIARAASRRSRLG